ncbi:MAG: DinB family protein [Chloroflexota bacterium]|nr:DinB family protein [Chloroflexota bacterium]
MGEMLSLDKVEQYVEEFATGDGKINEVAAGFSQQELRDFLLDNIDRLATMVEQMDAAQLAYRPSGPPTGWDASGDEAHFDASQLCTHVVSGISFHWWGITRALGQPRPDFPKPPAGALATGVKGGVMGAGGWSGESGLTLSVQLREAAGRFLDYLGEQQDLHAATGISSMGPFKKLTAHSWVMLDAVHIAMHVRQLERMQSAPDYPL